MSEILDATTKYSRSGRKLTPNKSHGDFYLQTHTTPSKAKSHKSNGSNDGDSSPDQDDPIDTISITASKSLFLANNDVAGSEIFQFSTPKKSDGMKRKVENTPKTPATELSRMSLNSPKTPRLLHHAALRTQNIATPTETRTRNKNVLKKVLVEESESESSADEDSDYKAEKSSDSDSTSDAEATASGDDDDDDDFEQPKQSASKRNAAVKQKPVAVPAIRTRGRPKKKSNENDFIPDSDNYFLTAANKKVGSSVSGIPNNL